MKTPIKPDFCIYHTFKMGPVSYVGPIFIYWVRDPIIHGPNINIELKLIINISLINTTLSSHNLILGHKTLVCLAISEPGDTMLNYFIQYINWLRICLLEALLQKSVMTTVCATRGNEQPGPKGRPNLWQRGLLYNSGDVTDLLRGPVSGAYHHTYFQFLFGMRLTSVRSYLWIVDREK